MWWWWWRSDPHKTCRRHADADVLPCIVPRYPWLVLYGLTDSHGQVWSPLVGRALASAVGGLWGRVCVSLC